MTRTTYRRIGDGHYIETISGIELRRGIDDSDGYDRIEWTIWSAGRASLLGVRDSLAGAQRRTREILTERTGE